MVFYYSIYDLPKKPSVYAMYGGHLRSYVAYVGETSNFKDRIDQHLRRRISSVVTGTFAAQINPDYVTEVKWWEHSSFHEKNHRKAAELIASEILQPALRSRSDAHLKKALEILNDEEYKNEIIKIFQGEPNGILVIPNCNYLLEKILKLEKRFELFEEHLREQTSK